jgi:Tol biopolymer transport system component
VLPDGDFSMSGVSWRQLITLGISGGLVPCPDAIAILLVAIAINRLVLGLSLVVTFSLGLAVVLIAIGLAMVQSRRLAERFTAFDRLVPVMPLISAIIVLGLGIVLTVNAVGRTSLLGLAPLESPSDTTLVALGVDRDSDLLTPFQLESAHVIYLAPQEAGNDQLFVVPAAGGEPRAFTTQTPGVWDFAISADGGTVAFAAARDGSGSAIWLADAAGAADPARADERLLLDCPNASCRNVVWAPDGSRLIYERVDFTVAASSVTDGASLWWVDVATGEAGPVFQDQQQPGASARWSPDGTWLSYVTSTNNGLQIYNLRTGENISLTNLTGMAALWHPAGSGLLMLDIQPDGARYLTHLIYYDLETREQTDLSLPPADADGPSVSYDDSTAAWSPDGEWLAVTRRTVTDDSTAPSNQVWLVRADGAEAYPVTDTPNVIHQQPAWSPDGRYLTYALYRLDEDWPKPYLYRLDIEAGEAVELAWPGSFPAWVVD